MGGKRASSPWVKHMAGPDTVNIEEEEEEGAASRLKGSPHTKESFVL